MKWYDILIKGRGAWQAKGIAWKRQASRISCCSHPPAKKANTNVSHCCEPTKKLTRSGLPYMWSVPLHISSPPQFLPNSKLCYFHEIRSNNYCSDSLKILTIHIYTILKCNSLSRSIISFFSSSTIAMYLSRVKYFFRLLKVCSRTSVRKERERDREEQKWGLFTSEQ